MSDRSKDTKEETNSVDGTKSSIDQPAAINNTIAANNNGSTFDQPFYNRMVDDISIVHIYRTLDCPVICFLPQRVGYYSCKLNPGGKTDTYLPDKSSLTYLRHDYSFLINLNLLEGIDQQESEIKSLLAETDHIFQWIKNEPQRDTYLSNVNFICTTSDILKSLMNSPYNDAVTWLIFAIKIDRKIYLTKRDPNSILKHGHTLTKEQVINRYLDFKFNELITLSQDGSPAPSHINGNRNSFYTVNKLEIGQHRILYPCRIDCAMSKAELDKPLEEMEFAITTTRPYPGLFPSKPSANTDRAIVWWVGGFLSGADRIICGDKINQFRVCAAKTIRTDTLVNVQNKLPCTKWTPKVCIDGMKRVLTHIGSHCHEENVVYGFRWDRDQEEIEFKRLTKPITTFIPEWYLGNDQ